MKTRQEALYTVDTPLEQIFNQNSYAQELLKSIGFNPAGQTDKTLRQICTEKQWSENEVLEWIDHHNSSQAPPADMFIDDIFKQNAAPSEVCNYLKKETIPEIERFVNIILSDYPRVLKVHATEHPWLKEAAPHADQLLDKLQYLTSFEKLKFFPLVDEYGEQKERILDRDVQNLKRSVQIVQDDHQDILKSIQIINRLSHNLHYPENAPSTLRILCTRLGMLFYRIQRHIEIEEKHLLPALTSVL